ncbi:hypothetical protein GAY28_00345 [Azospirillum brasilense]|nr:hypothetical protein [Azospirillum brasilense]
MTVLQEVVMMGWPSHLSGKQGLVRDGAVIKNSATGLVEGHMVPAFRCRLPTLPGISTITSTLNLGVSIFSFAYMSGQFRSLNKRLNHLESKMGRVDEKLDALIGFIANIDQKIDAIGSELAALSGKIDTRHRDMVFAEIGALLDTLTYADRKTTNDAQALVAQNLTHAYKAIRLYNSLIEEYESALSEDSLSRVEIIRMRILSSLLSIKIDIVMGEFAEAKNKADDFFRQMKENAGQIFLEIVAQYKLSSLILENHQTLTQFSIAFESVTGEEQTKFFAQLYNQSNTNREWKEVKILSAVVSANTKVATQISSLQKIKLFGGKVDVDGTIKKLTEVMEALQEAQDKLNGPLEGNIAQLDKAKICADNLMSLTNVAKGALVETALLQLTPGLAGKLQEVVRNPFSEEFVLLPA